MSKESMGIVAIEELKQMLIQKDKQQKYMTVKQWVTTFGYIPEGGIRHLIFSNPSFNQRVVRRLGRKVLLDIQELENWISEQHPNTAKAV